MTAVEWLLEKLEKGNFEEQQIAIEQAKEMEKQQLRDMYLKGIENYDPTFKKNETKNNR
jgi:hypothetical protein